MRLCFCKFLIACGAAFCLALPVYTYAEPATANSTPPEETGPVYLPPLRSPTLEPDELERSILETLLKVEEEERRKAEAEAKVEADIRAREERETALRDQQIQREEARKLQAERLARSKAISEAIKASMPPPPGVLPLKQDWPMPDLIEEPSWLSPAMALLYQSKYEKADFEYLYRLCLREALNGNPRAMLVLATAYERWGVNISGPFSVLHPPMHSSAFWRKWAEQMTSPAWVAKRLGDLTPTPAEKISYYTAAATQGDAEAMYKLGTLNNHPELLVEAALLGQPEASAYVAFNLLFGTEGFPASPRMAGYYWWRAAMGGDARALLLCSDYFFKGQNGFTKDSRKAVVFAQLALEAAQKEDLQAAAYSGSERLQENAERHLEGIKKAAAFNTDTLWEAWREVERIKSAPQEEKTARLNALRPEREAVTQALKAELNAVDTVIQNTTATDSENQILEKLESTLKKGAYEPYPTPGVDTAAHSRYNFRFILALILVFTLMPLTYLLVHKGVVNKFAKRITQ